MISAVLLALGALGPCAQSSACVVRFEVKDQKLEAAVVAALGALGLPRGSPAQVPALKKLGGDTAFALELDAAAVPMVVRARSLHRPPSLYGLAKVAPAKVPDRFRQRALAQALEQAIAEAMIDLQARLAEAAGVGTRRLKLSVQLNGLDGEARQYLAQTVLPCLLRQLDVVGGSTVPREAQGFLEDEVDYAPAADEPRDSVAWQTDRFRQALLGGPKSACTLVGSPLDRARVVVVADELGHGVLVSVKR